MEYYGTKETDQLLDVWDLSHMRGRIPHQKLRISLPCRSDPSWTRMPWAWHVWKADNLLFDEVWCFQIDGPRCYKCCRVNSETTNKFSTWTLKQYRSITGTGLLQICSWGPCAWKSRVGCSAPGAFASKHSDSWSTWQVTVWFESFPSCLQSPVSERFYGKEIAVGDLRHSIAEMKKLPKALLPSKSSHGMKTCQDYAWLGNLHWNLYIFFP